MIGCKKHFATVQEYAHYINDEANGLTNSKVINGLKYSVSFLPAPYLIMKDSIQANAGDSKFNSNNYNGNYTFLLSIKEDSTSMAQPSSDINYRELQNPEEYAERFANLNFAADEMATLLVGDKEAKPLLYHTVNTYGLSRKIEILYVFPSIPSGDIEDITFVFDDGIFYRGKILFTYSNTTLKKSS